jgi:chloramphenicol-sensitive protein RarD
MNPDKINVNTVSADGDAGENLRGVMAGLGAFCIWGLLVIYWKLLGDLHPFEQICHRMVWSLLALAPIVYFTGNTGEALQILCMPRQLVRLGASSSLLAMNWYLFIWSVEQNRILDSSLGYFINPLVNAVFGYIFLRERVSRLQLMGIALAAAGVGSSLLAYGAFPLLALSMAITFSLYGLIRKTTPVSPIAGLFIETLFMLPIAVTALGVHYGSGAPLPETGIFLILLCAGPATMTPLLLFNYAAKRIRLITLGIVQYISPSISFLLGLFLYEEHLSKSSLITFIFIWAGLALFTFSSWRIYRELPGYARAGNCGLRKLK